MNYSFSDFINRWEETTLARIDDTMLGLSSSRYILEQYSHQIKYINIDLKNTYPWIEKLDKFMGELLTWVHCNPSNPNIVNLSREVFIWAKPKQEFTNILNTPSGFNNFFNYLTNTNNPNGKIVTITGSKGKGKTYTQNYFLNTRTRDLAQAGYTWFRIDLTKILKYQKKGKKLSLSEYLYAQIVYVFFRYSQQLKDREVDPIFEEINIEELKIKAKKLYLELYNKNDFEDEYNNIWKLCRQQLPKNDGLNKPFKHPLAYILAKTIIELIQQNNKLYILFIDGIDNVDYAFDRNLQDWIHQIFYEEISQNIEPSTYVLTCRDETLKFIYQTDDRNGGGIVPKEYYLEVIQPKEIFETTIKSILDGNLFSKPATKLKLDIFKTDIMVDLVHHTPTMKIRDYYKFGLNFSKFVSIYVNKKIAPKDVLEVLYNNSLRDMLYDINHAYMYIYHYMRTSKEKNNNSIVPDKKLDAIKNLLVAEYIDKDNIYLIMAAIARHGKIYYNSMSVFVPPYLLLHSLNILSPLDFKAKVGLESKDVLLSIIILKYIQNKPGKLLRDIEEYCNGLGYINSMTIRILERKLLEHGLIEIDTTCLGESNNFELPRKITKRGKYLINESLSDIQILHAYCYEIYFPKIFFTNKLIKAYDNTFEEYPSAQVINILSLLKLLQIQANRNNLVTLNFFSIKLKNTLIKFMNLLPYPEAKEIINNFDKFMIKYSDNSLNECPLTLDELLIQYKNTDMTERQFKDLLEKCSFL